MWFIVLIGVYFAFQLFSSKEVLPPNAYVSLLIIPAAMYWLYFFFTAIKVNRKASYSADSIDSLVTVGAYGKIRHPLYSADIALVWGVFFVFPSVRVLAAVIWMTVILLLWMKFEEKALTQKFGEEYREYKKTVPMFIPKITRSKRKGQKR